MQYEGMRDFGAKCSSRSCTSGHDDPAKFSISTLMGVLKGRSAIRLYIKFPYIRKKPWGNHFWARGYFVDTVGVNEEIIRRYVRHQDKKDQEYEQQMELLQN